MTPDRKDPGQKAMQTAIRISTTNAPVRSADMHERVTTPAGFAVEQRDCVARAEMMNPLDSAGAQAEAPRKPAVRLELALAAVLLIVLLGSARLQATWAERLDRHASDAATILALAGVRAFADHGDPRALMEIPVGADSMVMKARVFEGEASVGTYAVRVVHVGPAAFRVRSTGRLVERGKSMMCSLDVFVQLAGNGTRPSMGVQREPLCNGSRHRSAVSSIRNIGS